MPLKKEARSFLRYAFGLTEKPGPEAALEVGAHTLRFVEFLREDGTLRLLNHAFKEIPPQNPSLPDQEETLRKEVKAFLDGLTLSAKKLTIGFSGAPVVVRNVAVPEMPKEELPKALRWAVRSQVPFDTEGSVLAFETVSTQQKRQDVILAIAEESRLVPWLTLIQGKGLRVREIGSTALALLQWLKEKGFFAPDTTALVDIGAFHATLFVVSAGRLLFVRDFPLGGETVTHAMMQLLSTEKGTVQLQAKEAERLKRSHGFPSEELVGAPLSRAQLVSLIRPVLERLAGELKRSLDFFSQESGLSVQQMFLVGGGSRLKRLDQFLQEKLQLPVKPLSVPVSGLPFKGTPSEEHFQKEFPVWASTLALSALRSLRPFDLLPERFRERKSAQVERIVVRLTAFILSVFLLFLCFFKVVQVGVLEKEKQILQGAVQKAGELERLRLLVLERRSLMDQLMKGHPLVGGLLKEISQTIPSNAVLDGLHYSGSEKTLLLSGTIFAAEEKPTEGLLGEMIARWEESLFFQEVRLISSERDATYGQQASNFKIECTLRVP